MITAKTKLCMVIGNPVAHSLSPQMLNAAFVTCGLEFVYVACRVENVKDALMSMRALHINAVNVTIPHKIHALRYVDRMDIPTRAIGATNLIVLKENKLQALNTDWIGAIRALEEVTSLANKKVAVIGAGGASRAIVYGLKKKNAIISVWNRTKSSGERLVQEFGLHRSFALSQTRDLEYADIIINTTSAGMEPHTGSSPIPSTVIHSKQIVFDIVYTPHETKLLKIAKENGAKRIFGYKMLLYGGAASFEAITGNRAPIDVMEKTLLTFLK